MSYGSDLDADGSLMLFDFLVFQTLFASVQAGADFDGDGILTVFDFLASRCWLAPIQKHARSIREEICGDESEDV